MITESEFIAAADRTLTAIGEALDDALAASDLDLDWSSTTASSKSSAKTAAS